MPVKTTEIEGRTYAELNEDGVPVYVLSDGAEQAYDGEELAKKVGEVNQEAARNRTALKEAKDKLKPFEGIDDLGKWREDADKALTTIANLDSKALIDAGKVEEIKAAAIKVIEDRHQDQIREKYEPAIKERDELRGQLHKEMIGGRFARSKFIEDKVAVPTPMVEAYFGHHFSIEDNRIAAKHADGSPVYSKAKPGEPADFEEALELIIEMSPFKENILKGTNRRGGGAPGSGNGSALGEKKMSRLDADKLSRENPVEMAKRMSDGWVVMDPM